MSANQMNSKKAYWQSLEDLADTPEFRERASQEFPGFVNVYESLGVAEVKDGVSRRQFLALSAAGLGLAGMAGCRRPDLQILPFGRTVDETNKPLDLQSPGLPLFYATAMPRPGGCFPLLVESHDGRPTKAEGNPLNPFSQGSSDLYAQASVLDVYSPDRSREVKRGGEPKSWEEFDNFAASHFAKVAKEGGKGFAILAEHHPSPSTRLIREHLKGVFKDATWHTYEPIDLVGPARQGAKLAFGQPLQPVHKFDKALRVLSIDCDFLGIEENTVANSLGYSKARRGKDGLHQVHDHGHDHKHDHGHGDMENAVSRLYVVESGFTVTGGMADHRLRLPGSSASDYAVALAKHIAAKTNAPWKAAADKAAASTVSYDRAKWIDVVTEDLLAFKGKSLIVAGHRQPAIVHALVAAMNDALGNTGVTVEYKPVAEEADRDIKQLAKSIEKGEVTTLMVLGGNPAFSAPADLEFAKLIEKVPTVIRLGLFEDETSLAKKDAWHLPMAHYLESWGDAETSDGTYCSLQPLIAPLHDGRSALEILVQISGYEKSGSYLLAKTKAYELVQKAFASKAKSSEPVKFRKFLHEGFLPGSSPEAVKPTVGAGLGDAVGRWQPSQPVTATNFEVAFAPSYGLFDGRYAMNAWMMELPDPITKLVWDNAAFVSHKTAGELGVKKGDHLKIELSGKSIEVPAYILPGHADHCVTLPLGFKGKQSIPHAGSGGGFNVYPVRNSESLYFAPAKVAKTRGNYDLVTTQEKNVIPEDRDETVQEYGIDDYVDQVLHPHHEEPKKDAKHEGGAEAQVDHHHLDNPKLRFQYGYKIAQTRSPEARIQLEVSYAQPLDSHYQWGMSIDLNSCTGCSVCVIACQAENNIPVVGKGEVKRNREMHWIRLDRYFTNVDVNQRKLAENHEGKPDIRKGATEPIGDIDEARIVTQPLACLHCEAAPCESVCPVNASVHSPEGLNLQVYNRCIGTRYCSNNCPYKVRRFNWFDFNQRQLDSLRVPTFLGQINGDEGRDADSLSPKGVPETLKMQKNPDVTVRMRGVMEKCTYCIQRLNRATIGAKVAAAKANYEQPKDPMAAGYELKQIDGKQKIFSPDGLIQVACEQACPTKAIVFGNVADEKSRVFKLKQREGDFLVLGSRNTKPRTSHLPRLRNLNDKMLATKKEAQA